MLRDGEYHGTVVKIQYPVCSPSTQFHRELRVRARKVSSSGSNFVKKRHALDRILRNACRSDRLPACFNMIACRHVDQNLR